MNVLLCSVGKRNLIVKYFKETIRGVIIATDMRITAPALYEADRYYIVSKITTPGYIDELLNICKKEEIDAILSLIDPELNLLAKNENRFMQIGVRVIGSSFELCEMALNKMKMFHWLEKSGYNCARSYDDKDAFYRDLETGLIKFPVFVKPIHGSGSNAISKVEDKETLEFLWHRTDELMIQEYLEGQEIGADVYIDLISHDVVSIFTKKKLLMRSGETDKSVSFKDEKLFELIICFCKDAGWSGQIDIDIFECNGQYYINEVNPRFGGGYPHAYVCGVNHIKLIENNINGIANMSIIGSYNENMIMMKYIDVMVIDQNK